ncbi:hypothetical protein U4E84_03490 [Halorubrum sp. AD140]|nr:hypothetical protein [Halorubrum sp. AD140]MDZ5810415.1 hypothetical protein [Halorubrum sp. AD140]
MVERRIAWGCRIRDPDEGVIPVRVAVDRVGAIATDRRRNGDGG